MTSAFKIKRIVVPYKAIQQLDREHRYALLLVGHVFNEIMALQRFAMMCNMKSSRKRSKAEGAGGTFNTLFFLRILAGKLHEASLVLRRKEVTGFLRDHCFPLLQYDGTAALRDFNKAASNCKWLNAARNQHSMHYPTVEQVSPALDAMEMDGAGFEFFVGNRHGETLYWSSDVMAGIAFVMEAGIDGYKNALGKIFDDVIDLSRQLLALTADSINSFALSLHEKKAEFPERVKVRDVEVFDMPDVSEFELPYFVIMR